MLPMPGGWALADAGGLRPCAVLSRLHVSYAIELFKAGVLPVASEDIGEGNEACAACIREYKDALAAVVIRRWMRGDGAMEWLCLVGESDRVWDSRINGRVCVRVRVCEGGVRVRPY